MLQSIIKPKKKQLPPVKSLNLPQNNNMTALPNIYQSAVVKYLIEKYRHQFTSGNNRLEQI